MHVCIFPGELIMTFPRDWEMTQQLAVFGQPCQGCQVRPPPGGDWWPRGPHRQSMMRSSLGGEHRLKNAIYFSNLLVQIVPETNTSRPWKKCFYSFTSALSHLPQSGRKKQRNRFRGCFVWLAAPSAPFASGRDGWGVIWRPPH